MRTKKENISVDHHRQNIEKNISWKDYPCINFRTGRKLPNRLYFYFPFWSDYCKNGNDTNYDLK